MFKKGILVSFIFSITLFSYSQQYVDITTAKKKVEALQKANSDLTTKADTLRKEISDLREKNKNNEKQIGEISSMLNTVGVKSSALYYYSKEISDEVTKSSALNAYNKNKESQKKLESKRDALNLEIRENKRLIDVKDVELSDALYKIETNTLEIRKLEASINKTSGQNDLVNSYIKDVDSYSSQVEALIK